MSFAGTVSAMITSLKNNSRSRKRLYDRNFIFKKTGKNKFKPPHIAATPEQIQQIRKTMVHENHIITVKRIIALCIALVITGLLLYFSLPLLHIV